MLLFSSFSSAPWSWVCLVVYRMHKPASITLRYCVCPQLHFLFLLFWICFQGFSKSWAVNTRLRFFQLVSKFNLTRSGQHPYPTTASCLVHTNTIGSTHHEINWSSWEESCSFQVVEISIRLDRTGRAYCVRCCCCRVPSLRLTSPLAAGWPGTHGHLRIRPDQLCTWPCLGNGLPCSLPRVSSRLCSRCRCYLRRLVWPDRATVCCSRPV